MIKNIIENVMLIGLGYLILQEALNWIGTHFKLNETIEKNVNKPSTHEILWVLTLLRLLYLMVQYEIPSEDRKNYRKNFLILSCYLLALFTMRVVKYLLVVIKTFNKSSKRLEIPISFLSRHISSLRKIIIKQITNIK